MKKALSVVQMKQLEDLGIDTSDASMLYNRDRLVNIDFPVDKKAVLESEDMSFAYTVDDILNKMYSISYKGDEYILVSCKIDRGVWSVGYHCIDDLNNILKINGADVLFSNDEHIESAYNMLKWYMEPAVINNEDIIILN